jgi:hypothetical protein
MVTAMFAETLEHLEHTTRLTRRPKLYTANVQRFAYISVRPVALRNVDHELRTIFKRYMRRPIATFIFSGISLNWNARKRL